VLWLVVVLVAAVVLAEVAAAGAGLAASWRASLPEPLRRRTLGFPNADGCSVMQQSQPLTIVKRNSEGIGHGDAFRYLVGAGCTGQGRGVAGGRLAGSVSWRSDRRAEAEPNTMREAGRGRGISLCEGS